MAIINLAEKQAMNQLQKINNQTTNQALELGEIEIVELDDADLLYVAGGVVIDVNAGSINAKVNADFAEK
ncbi:MAG: hypothetical protein V7K77_14295 [Nostoc sp.]|uniref:hypothetical protein n=1 Tax=Nostoc sp. TaxID=1180 RepID=UPI002FF8F1B2